MEEVNGISKRVLWWGAVDAEFSWLKRRVANFTYCFDNKSTKLELHAVREPMDCIGQFLDDGPVDRIIVACQNRWDYPLQEIQQLACSLSDVPIAVAIGDWWLGWRRTGIGHSNSLPHLCLPWYRWWDGWAFWLSGEEPALFGPFPQVRATNYSVRIANSSPVDVCPPATGLLFCGDASCTTWARTLNCVDHTEANQLDKNRVERIIWDDSQLDTSLGWEKNLVQAIEQLIAIRTNYPHAKLWIAWTLPTWELYSHLSQAGLEFELLAKPYLSSLSSAALART